MSRLTTSRGGNKGIAGKEKKVWMHKLKGHIQPSDLEVGPGEAESTCPNSLGLS